VRSRLGAFLPILSHSLAADGLLTGTAQTTLSSREVKFPSGPLPLKFPLVRLPHASTSFRIHLADYPLSLPAAAQYAAGIAGIPAGGPELLATVPAAPRGTVDEDRLVAELQSDAVAASLDTTVDDTAAQKIAVAAGKMAEARDQDVQWVEKHKGKDPRADEEAEKLGM
jgi:hypothetical protein